MLAYTFEFNILDYITPFLLFSVLQQIPIYSLLRQPNKIIISCAAIFLRNFLKNSNEATQVYLIKSKKFSAALEKALGAVKPQQPQQYKSDFLYLN